MPRAFRRAALLPPHIEQREGIRLLEEEEEEDELLLLLLNERVEPSWSLRRSKILFKLVRSIEGAVSEAGFFAAS